MSSTSSTGSPGNVAAYLERFPDVAHLLGAVLHRVLRLVLADLADHLVEGQAERRGKALWRSRAPGRDAVIDGTHVTQVGMGSGVHCSLISAAAASTSSSSKCSSSYLPALTSWPQPPSFEHRERPAHLRSLFLGDPALRHLRDRHGPVLPRFDVNTVPAQVRERRAPQLRVHRDDRAAARCSSCIVRTAPPRCRPARRRRNSIRHSSVSAYVRIASLLVAAQRGDLLDAFGRVGPRHRGAHVLAALACDRALDLEHLQHRLEARPRRTFTSAMDLVSDIGSAAARHERDDLLGLFAAAGTPCR